jgi:CopG family nickel-responsive transcriptional regulator
MELYVLEGNKEELSRFVNTVRAVPDVRAVDYSITAPGNGPVGHQIES